MYLLKLICLVMLAYLYGSINMAILIAEKVKGVNIRAVGTKNPGTSNITRNIGFGWGVLVFFFDLSKALFPLIIARLWLFPQATPAAYAAQFATGIAAIGGHCRPLFFQFRGGGGIATSIGVYYCFIPVEFSICMLTGFLLSQLFFRHKDYPLGQITPMLFVTLTPFFTLFLNLLGPLRISPAIRLGGHPWYIVLGVFAISLFILLMNYHLFFRRLQLTKNSP